MKSWTKAVGIAAGSLALAVVGVTSAAGDSSSAVGRLAQRPPPVVHAANSPAVVDVSASESTYVPIAPCRIVDSRIAGGHLLNGGTRSFAVSGTTGFTTQGGSSAGCGIPTGANAIAAVFAAVSPHAGGYFKAYPAGQTAPASSILNYGAATTSSGVTLAIATGVTPALTVFNHGGPTYIVIDVTGYYQTQISADILGGGTFFNHTPRVLSVTHTVGSGLYAVVVDRPDEVCTAHVSAVDQGFYASAITESSNTTNVRIWTAAGGTPTAADDEFNFALTC
jgi:hypothetical protein